MAIDTETGPEFNDGNWETHKEGTEVQTFEYNPGTFHHYTDHVLSSGAHIMGDGELDYTATIEDSHYEQHSKGFRVYHDYFYSTSDEIVGNDLDNTITGTKGLDARGMSYGWRYKAPDMSIFGQGGADTITTFSGDDRISGGAGNDVIHTGLGDDLVYGGEDNDQLFGEAGTDDLYGGAGNDILDGGAGADNLDGGSGNDVLLTGDLSEQTGNESMRGGKDADVFVIGNGEFNTSTSSISVVSDAQEDWTNDGADFALDSMSMIPGVGQVFSVIETVFDLFSAIGDATSEAANFTATVHEGVSNAVQIEDFNALEDMVVIPMSDAEWGDAGELSLSLSTEGIADSEAFRLYSDGGANEHLIASISMDSLAEDLPAYALSALDTKDVMDAYVSDIEESMVILNGGDNGTGTVVYNDQTWDANQVGPDGEANYLAELGDNQKVLVLGASVGAYHEGTANSDYEFGTNMNDVLIGYDVGNSSASGTAGADYLYGFGGDDLLIGGDVQGNQIYGGDDNDTVSYLEATQGVHVDLTPETDATTTFSSSTFNSSDTYAYGTATVLGDANPVATSTDLLFEIENVAGSAHDDDIHGDGAVNVLHGNAGDDVLDGGAGFDELWGGDGADAFIFADGDHQYFSNTKLGADIDRVMDFEIGEDTIYIDVSSFDQTKVDSIDDIFVAQVDGDSYLNYAFEKDTGQTNFHTVAVVEDALLTTSDIALYDDALFA